MVQSIRLSVRLSHLFTVFPSSYYHEIFRSDYQWQTWCPCTRSEIKGQGHRGQNPFLRFRDRNSSFDTTMATKWYTKLQITLKKCLLIFKVIHQISRSCRKKIADFDPNWAFLACNSSLNSAMAKKWCAKLGSRLGEVPHCFSRSNFKVTLDKKITNCDPNWAFTDCNSSLNSPMALKWCTTLYVV